jgi:hypothetical protein
LQVTQWAQQHSQVRVNSAVDRATGHSQLAQLRQLLQRQHILPQDLDSLLQVEGQLAQVRQRRGYNWEEASHLLYCVAVFEVIPDIGIKGS